MTPVSIILRHHTDLRLPVISCRSHMWFGAHLLVLVLTAVCVGLKLSFVALFSYVIVITALLCAPFWFNPFTWDWDRNKVGCRDIVNGYLHGYVHPSFCKCRP